MALASSAFTPTRALAVAPSSAWPRADRHSRRGHRGWPGSSLWSGLGWGLEPAVPPGDSPCSVREAPHSEGLWEGQGPSSGGLCWERLGSAPGLTPWHSHRASAAGAPQEEGQSPVFPVVTGARRGHGGGPPVGCTGEMGM